MFMSLMCEPAPVCACDRVCVCVCVCVCLVGEVFHFYLSHPLVKSHTAFNHFSPLVNTISSDGASLSVYITTATYLINFYFYLTPSLPASLLLCAPVFFLFFFVLFFFFFKISFPVCVVFGCQHSIAHSVAHFWTWKTEIRTLLNIAPKLQATCCLTVY